MNLQWPRAAALVRERIGDGTLKPGARPSVTRLAAELGIGRKTAGKALSVLEGEGLLERKAGTGYAVLPPPGTAPAPPG